MECTSRLNITCIVLVVCAATAIGSHAQTLTTLHSFLGTDGNAPYNGLVLATDGNFYGTTDSGGSHGDGTVFKITTGGTLTTLYSFAGTDGSNPSAALIQATDGNLYGTTFGGGANDDGTVFKITPTGTLTTLYSFSDSEGAYPLAGIVQASDGNFYGTTEGGGAYNNGTIFKITPAGTLTTLHSFASGTEGANPFAAVVQGTDGNFYGTTVSGGASAYGTVFRITMSGGLTTLHSFAGTDGAFPYAGLVQGTDGNFYGTTYESGAYGYGTIFKITPSGTLTNLHSFTGSDGSKPYAPVMQGTDGNFYGTTLYGGAYNDGTIFKITATGTLTHLHSFDSNDGSYPKSALVQGTDGNLYGTTQQGGAYTYYGTIFKLAVGLQPFTNLHSFSGTDGSDSSAGLVQGTDGNFYGTTASGGAAGLYGTVFKMTPAGTVTTLYSFCTQTGCTDGSSPLAALVQGTDGNFYGTTEEGGAYDCGTVFRITPGDVLTTLHSFGIDGCSPSAGLVQASDGNLYGTTYSGGPYEGGTVFQITPSGTLTVLYGFCERTDCTDGYSPDAALVQATDGNLYGTTYSGGVSGAGVIFRISLSGKIIRLHSFCSQTGCTDGSYPMAGLVQATDGNFYGTTELGGAYGYGTVFKISPAGLLATLHSFTGVADGLYPEAELVQATDGNFYGTTSGFGSNYGTVFKMTPAGTMTTLYSFCPQTGCTDGSSPLKGLEQATDGNLYGTTSAGGQSGYGTIFKLSLGIGPFVQAEPVLGEVGAAVVILGTNLTGAIKVRFNGTAATFTVESSSEITTTVPSGATTGSVTVARPTGTLKSNVSFRVTPQILGFAPTSGTVGTLVTITGVSLKQTKTVTFGGVKATTFTVISDTEVQATVPSTAKTGHIAITTTGGTAISSGIFTVT